MGTAGSDHATTAAAKLQVPRVGMFATVRHRRGVVMGIEPFDGPSGRLHLVHIDYKDDQFPRDDSLIWELEPKAHLLEPTALPNVDKDDPMPVEDFDALLRAVRWSAATPFIDPDEAGPLGPLPLASPFHGAVQVDDFQLVPLLKALRMPRVSLLLADDVGLGKTVEAGLILTELLLRRRVQRVLILTPASLRLQWQDEMWDKFSLSFDLVDRDRTHDLRRRLGMDANPWRSFSRIIASYHYLRQENVLEEFLAPLRDKEGSPELPWDLLIVDECHNLMPAAFGEDSELCRMLRLLAPYFEHRLFLSATPHNGHTRCFTGLLEILDPVRFSQTDELSDKARERMHQVVIRRLKREINERTNPPKFCTRLKPEALELRLASPEIALSGAFDAFRKAIHQLIARDREPRQRAGRFAVEILGKRLLSCAVAFAESWRRCKQGLAEPTEAKDQEVRTASQNLESETGDDRETHSRVATASSVVGAWLKGVAASLQSEIAGLDAAIAGLRLNSAIENLTDVDPLHDSRYAALERLIQTRLQRDHQWRDDERLVVFTEYKTTLDYLARRLTSKYGADRMLTLFGGMDDAERSAIKTAFNDPAHPVRVLVATDAAAEGLNLQRTSRYLLHFDCPWNPSRIEQRNGRIDRHGQPRDVTIFHFMTDDDQDIAFLSHVIRKADEIREDLGSANESFDVAAHRRLIRGEDAGAVQALLDQSLHQIKQRSHFEADKAVDTRSESHNVDQELKALAAEIDLDPDSLRETLESAMAIGAGRPQLTCIEPPKTYRIDRPDLPGWSDVIDDSVRRKERGGAKGAVARLAFEATPFLEQIGARTVFSPRTDVLMAHLSHPLIQHAVSLLTRRRFPGTGMEVSRWTLRRAPLPKGVDALILLSVEELAVNDLRETFHHWVRTLVFPVAKGELGAPWPHQSALALRGAVTTLDPDHRRAAREVFEDVEPALKAQLRAHGQHLSEALRLQLDQQGKQAIEDEAKRYQSRQGEISALITKNTIEKLHRQIRDQQAKADEGWLFADAIDPAQAPERKIAELEAEIERRTRHHVEIGRQLESERNRVLKHVLPNRYAMAKDAQVFPLTVEIRLPGGAS